jgi:hypothetical protein
MLDYLTRVLVAGDRRIAERSQAISPPRLAESPRIPWAFVHLDAFRLPTSLIQLSQRPAHLVRPQTWRLRQLLCPLHELWIALSE